MVRGFDTGTEGDFKVENGVAFRWTSGQWVQQTPGPIVVTTSGVMYDIASNLPGFVAPNNNYYIPIAIANPPNLPISGEILEVPINQSITIIEIVPGAFNSFINNSLGIMGIVSNMAAFFQPIENSLRGSKIQFNSLFSDPSTQTVFIFFTDFTNEGSSTLSNGNTGSLIIGTAAVEAILSILGKITLLAGIISFFWTLIAFITGQTQQTISNNQLDAIQANNDLLQSGYINSDQWQQNYNAILNSGLPSGSGFTELIQMLPFLIGAMIIISVIQSIRR
jgi:hypothetical protein